MNTGPLVEKLRAEYNKPRFVQGQTIRHATYGRGLIQSLGGSRAVCEFSHDGFTLSIEIEQSELEAA